MNTDSSFSVRPVRSAAVLGAGVMGGAIAAHFANAGLSVLLLDLPAAEGDRNGLAQRAVAALAKQKPAPLFRADFARRIQAGNFEDDLARLADVDWVIEAVVERLDIKTKLWTQVAEAAGEHTILSTNTSGIPIADIAAALPEPAQARFLGTHFFNPPRYMHLLELIAGPKTDGAVMQQVTDFAEHALGKGVVVAKDRPNFIANRIGTYGVMRTVELMLERKLGVEAVDALSGPLVGRPKSATFRTVDLVGLDVVLHVAGNVRDGAPDDPELATFTPPKFLEEMAKKKLLGGKTGGGFYRKVKADGGSVIEAIDPGTLEYRPKEKARFPELETLRAIEDLRPRLKAVMKTKGKGSEFAAAVLRDTLRYAAAVADEVAFDIASIDRAMRWGFGWDLGPFETWDAIGLVELTEQMAADGKPAPDWVRAHIEAGATSFYDTDGLQVLSPKDTSKQDVPPRAGVLDLRETKHGPRRLKQNAGASLWDLGDGVLGLEFHSKMNSLGGDAMAMSVAACEMAESGYAGIVVGNQGVNFSVGANVALLLMAALEGEYEDIDLMVRQFQRMTMGLRGCTKPVVVAPFNMALGGGAEITLHGDAVVASAELYMGLVEAGVGLIPAGGGTKEMYLRMLDEQGPAGDPRAAARRAFETIGMGKVSMSAHEAKGLGFLNERDRIVLNRDHVLAAAKAEVLALAQGGYRPQPMRTDVPVGGDETFALLEIGLYNFQAANQISEHDAVIGRKLAQILSGGAHRNGPSPRVVSEQDLLDLEREAFLSLCGERKTLERIQHMLTTGKPLRN